MNNKDKVNVEIDLLVVLQRIWSKKFRILFVALLFSVGAFFASKFLIAPKYTATTRIYVVNQNNQNNQNNLTAQDLQAGSYLVSDYKEIITSREVVNDVIVQNHLKMTIEELTHKLAVTIPSDTRVISISVTDENPSLAAKLSNSIRKVSSVKIKDVTKVQDVTTLEKAEKPNTPSSPNVRKNTILGFAVGAFITIVMLIIFELLDDRIKSSDDVEEVLGATLLGIVPDVNKL